MSFGQTIKHLRREANMTQEQLADILSISPQAVSRWETEAAMPDISLLPPLANLFNVTTDLLLGMEAYQRDLRKSEFDEAFHEYWNHDDKEKNYQIAMRAVAEYPGNMEYVEWLASDEYYVALLSKDKDKYKALLESAEKHYITVLKNTSNKKLYSKALHGIVLTLNALNRKEEAKEYAMKEQDESEREELLLWCLDGDDKKKLSQEIANTYLYQFLFYLTFDQKTPEAFDAVEKILNIAFPDGNLQYYHNMLQYHSLGKAYCLAKEENWDGVMEALEKARYHAQEMTKVNGKRDMKFTAPLFNLIEEQHMVSDSPTTDLDDFINSVKNNPSFTPIRETEDFKRLIL